MKEFKVCYIVRGQRRELAFTMGQEALMFARHIARELRIKPTALQVRAPWGQFVPWRA